MNGIGFKSVVAIYKRRRTRAKERICSNFFLFLGLEMNESNSIVRNRMGYLLTIGHEFLAPFSSSVISVTMLA
jgi:hypothetical protein